MPVLFLVFWLILNARITVEVVLIGVLVSALMSLFTYRIMGYNKTTEKKVWARIFPILSYLAVLVVEVVKANIQIIKLVLSPKIEIRPKIVYFDCTVRSDAAKVALGNSITLTPGTITIDIDGNRFGVHAIDTAFAEGIEDTDFAKALQKIEGGH